MSITDKIDHIAIAVSNLEAAVKTYEKLFGVKPSKIEDIPERGTRVAFFKIGETKIELVTPLEGKGPVADFLAKKGHGMHHICLEVKNIEKVLADYRSQGFKLIDETPRTGAGGRKIAFLHPSSAEGVLIELSESPVSHFKG